MIFWSINPLIYKSITGNHLPLSALAHSQVGGTDRGSTVARGNLVVASKVECCVPGFCVRIANRINSNKAKVGSTITSNFIVGGEANIGTASIIFVDSKNDSTM